MFKRSFLGILLALAHSAQSKPVELELFIIDITDPLYDHSLGYVQPFIDKKMSEMRAKDPLKPGKFNPEENVVHFKNNEN